MIFRDPPQEIRRVAIFRAQVTLQLGFDPELEIVEVFETTFSDVNPGCAEEEVREWVTVEQFEEDIKGEAETEKPRCFEFIAEYWYRPVKTWTDCGYEYDMEWELREVKKKELKDWEPEKEMTDETI